MRYLMAVTLVELSTLPSLLDYKLFQHVILSLPELAMDQYGNFYLYLCDTAKQNVLSCRKSCRCSLPIMKK